jgi:hypothetical protein
MDIVFNVDNGYVRHMCVTILSILDKNPNEIITFIREVTDNNKKVKDQTVKEKTDFLKDNFPTESADLGVNDLYKKIGEKRKEVLEKDSNLYRRVENLLPLIKKAN